MTCAAVTTAHAAELAPVSAVDEERFGLVPNFSHFAIVGRCAACRSEQRAARRHNP